MKNFKKIFYIFCMSLTVVLLSACSWFNKPAKPTAPVYTFRDYTAVSPSNWNELTYQDNNDRQIMSRIGSSFFEYNFKFDGDGNIIDGDYVVEYSAATALEDVTSTYVGDKYGIPEGAKHRAFKITLRSDLKWDDGTPINAHDFVYTMKQQLDPLFQNYRADSYYNSSLVIHNAREYVYQGQHGLVPIVSDSYGEDEYISMENFRYVNGVWTFGDETNEIVLKLSSGGNWGSNGLKAYGNAGYFSKLSTNELGYIMFADEEGNVVCYAELNVEGGIIAYYHFDEDLEQYVLLTETDGVLYLGAVEFANLEDLTKVKEFLPFYQALLDAADSEGTVILNHELIVHLQDAIAVLHNHNNVAEYAAAVGDYAYIEWQEMCFHGKDFDEVAFEDVGIFVGDTDYELIIIIDQPLALLNEDGTLSYRAAYNLSSLPLVKESLYEANKVAPSTGSTLWTSTYNSSLSSTASWGPYKLKSFQSGKEYTLERNTYWYGYNLEQYKDQYQTDYIVCETIKEWNTAWLKFLAGEIDVIGIDKSVADIYKHSPRAYFTPDDYVGSLQLQSSYESLKNRESEGINKTILSYVNFRKALSLGIDRADYNTKTTTSSLPGFGLFTSVHYYDVENGGVYRFTDYARQTLCDIYAIDVSQFGSLTEAADSITGYDLVEARRLVDLAYQEALNDGEISSTDTVLLTVGTSAINEATQRQFNFLKETYTNLMIGTDLEGRIEFELVEKGSTWANDFRAGAYDICTGGWTGAAWDPGYFLLAYLSPNYMYSKGWDTSAAMMTFTFQGQEHTMSLIEWYNCLNGIQGAAFDWSSSALTNEERLPLIASLEKAVLEVYYTVPLTYYFSASLISFKTDYITYEYNTFMSYGGIRYLKYNYSDSEWKEHIKNELDYK